MIRSAPVTQHNWLRSNFLCRYSYSFLLVLAPVSEQTWYRDSQVVLCGTIRYGQSHRELTDQIISDAETEELELDPTAQAGREKEAVELKRGSEVLMFEERYL